MRPDKLLVCKQFTGKFPTWRVVAVPLILCIQSRSVTDCLVMKGWWFIMRIHKNPIFESHKLFVIWIYLELQTKNI